MVQDLEVFVGGGGVQRLVGMDFAIGNASVGRSDLICGGQTEGVVREEVQKEFSVRCDWRGGDDGGSPNIWSNLFSQIIRGHMKAYV